ncbi:MAG: hypothetical protein M1832_002166 [Thelocarpon impressellum]|nr:MAG: hypothetical protein M1832_002166 [Thelocarpon impressellum]
METTFISIHDLSADARLLYTSDSIVDILGYGPQEVIGRSCFDYFHPEEIPFARSVHGRGVHMDKAAVLNYCRIRSKYGHWVGCECVFTVVYDVLVASTSIYRRGMKSQKRAVEAPIIRRLFSSSPRDPRYHMLSLLSTKFSAAPSIRTHEPRAALFLNRFTRTLAIMYATTALSSVLGVTAEEAKGKSFYECIQENCLHDAIRCLEGAKANDSIAYLRFWFRDPRRRDQDQRMADVTSSDEDDDGGVHLDGRLDERMEGDGDERDEPRRSDPSTLESRSSSGNSTDLGRNSNANIFGEARANPSSDSSVTSDDGQRRSPLSQRTTQPRDESIEVEAVVSCTSDGLVVILRRARPVVALSNVPSPRPVYANGLFAAPWATAPILPEARQAAGLGGHFLPASYPAQATASQPMQGSTGPSMDEFMNSIREVAVFAWSLTGINGSLAEFGRGNPHGESQPPDGFPVWDPNSNSDEDSPCNGVAVDQHDHVAGEGWLSGGYVQPMDATTRNGHGHVGSNEGSEGKRDGYRWF